MNGRLSGHETLASAGPNALTEAELDFLHKLACTAVAAAVKDPKLLHQLPQYSEEALLRTLAGVDAASLGPSLTRLAGAFVTITNNGRLRGCQGSIAACAPLYSQVLSCAVKSAVADHRFTPCTVEELSELHIGVSVLTEPTPIASHEEYQLGVHGIILKKHGCRAVFLPEVPTEHHFTKEVTLSRLSVKAGLAEGAWREGASFEVFYTQKYGKPMRL
eukprot:RCo045179